MILGKILENDKKIELKIGIHCTKCGKQVPGGIKTGEKFSKTDEFKIELDEFMKNYLCGICRDKKRTKESKN
ncbi:MAG: hypothetical protein H8D31_08745 [Nitrosopumilus sp.]|nr:hypothetical protein [Nitrosopumilus sp.]MBC8517306.1 hypothetical protein [Nitrosopumilus sp.]